MSCLSREIAKSVAQPDVRERLAALGFKPVANTPDEFAARIKLEMEKWGKVVRDANLKIECAERPPAAIRWRTPWLG